MYAKCAVLAGAVIGSFSWFSITDAFWLASACWYTSLFLSVLGILLSAQQMAVFQFLGDVPHSDCRLARSTMNRYRPLLIERAPSGGSGSNTQTLNTEIQRYRPKRSMVFTWQCPMMFMSYSVCLFLLGLTLVVITPLIRIRKRGWNDAVNVTLTRPFLANLLVANKRNTGCNFLPSGSSGGWSCFLVLFVLDISFC